MASVAGLAPGEVDLLRDVIGRRRPELLPIVERIGKSALNDFERSSLRRAVVDELCDHLLPGQRAAHRDVELSDLLMRLGQA